MAKGELVKQSGKLPTRKVGAGGIGGAVATLVLWGLSAAGVELSPDSAVAVAGMVATLSGFATAYLTRDRAPKPTTPRSARY
jgi:hypothetical protein